VPEAKVGLVPTWGGCTQLLLRAQTLPAGGANDPLAAARAAFQTIFGGGFSRSALDARANGLLREEDSIIMNRRNLVAAAKARAAGLAEAGYRVPQRALIAVAGPPAKLEIMNTLRSEPEPGRYTDTDLHLADMLASILTGGREGDPRHPVNEEELMQLERVALLQLVRRPETRARIDHMLRTGKPLRN